MKPSSFYAPPITVFLLALLVGSLHADGIPDKLLESMKAVILAAPLDAQGTTAEEQFGDVLQKISVRYAERWKAPLPVWIDLPVLAHLQSSPGLLDHGLAPALHDAPLDVVLRSWCGRVGACFRVQQNAVFISLENRPQ
jgi:hypothetical protein